MKQVSCIIVDDEPLALDLLESYVKRTEFLKLVARCSSAYEAMEILNKEQIELLFLDIQMPELNGIQLARLLKNEQKVIFTTAFEKYALEGFKVDALDYLLKPFNYDEFLKAANKSKIWFRVYESQQNVEKLNSSIFVKADYKLIKVDVDKILYIEGLKDYVKIHLTDTKKPIITLVSLKLLEQQLPQGIFMRIHRSFIINLKQILQIERNQVVMNETVRITIADMYKEKFLQYIDSRLMNS